ncbi:MAG: radical SAM protein [Patescibacteria group bacterium]
MKIFISYPPLISEKGIPLLGQNRQFQWFNSPTYIYPVIPAYMASLLEQNGEEVFWDDAIAEGLSYDKWLERFFLIRPDLMIIETKTPVIKRHWRIINELKEKADWPLTIALVGDHVTANPEESLRYSRVDYVLSGGDYDFGALSLVKFLSGQGELESGWHSRLGGEWDSSGKNEIINWHEGEFKNCEFKNSGLKQDYHLHDLNSLPLINRELTKWKMYAYKNGNFKYTPGTYIMSGRDCWWGRCTFCSWTTLFPGSNFRTRSAQLALDEVGHLIDLGVKEIMEDSGSLPIGKWLEDFCNGMIERGYQRKVTMSCNMRINGISDPEIWKLMKRAGFRFILFGLESANQKTLDEIDKNLRVAEIEPGLKMCKEAGLEPHITAMIGYPWESYEEAKRTVDLAKDLFKKNYVNTLQATVLIPYPGTPLYQYCQNNDLLNFTDYDRFDQREQVMKCPLTTEQVKDLTQGLYKAFITPKFVFNKIKSIRSFADIKFLGRAGLKVFGHLMDFKK